MRKKFLTAYVIVGIFLLSSSIAAIYNHPAFAKNPPSIAKANAAMMAKFSTPKKQNDTPARKSRLKQMNIIGEAATVLNVLPITIINEMKMGKTLVQIAKSKGLTEKEFLQKLSALETKTVDHAVNTGVISKKQRIAINEGKAARLKRALKTKGVNVHDHAPMDMGN